MTQNEKWFMLDIGQVEKKLKTNAASGLSRKAARSRWNKSVGSVYIPGRKTWLQMLGALVTDFAWILLLLAAMLSLLFGDFHSGIAVLAIAFLHLIAVWIGYYRSERTLESMRGCFRPYARVIRGGRLYQVDYSHIVPGDVLLLARGDMVRADLRLVTSDSLRVRMLVDLNTEVSLEKYAGGGVRPHENRVENLVNMVHAGSVVETGSARGIVTAVGKYTYLAARTGGIPENTETDIPECLQQMKKLCSRINMISLLCVLPFCLISLLVSHLRSGDVLLSAAFLTALAITASSMSQLALTLCKSFFVVKIRRLLSPEDTTAVRSPTAMERLEAADYLFVLDGAALSDGRMHFETAVTLEGEIRQYDHLAPSATVLGTMTALYCMAEKRSLSVGIDVTEQLSDALLEFCRKCAMDRGELAIRYPQLTYFPGNGQGSQDCVRYIESGQERWISLSSADILGSCTTAVVYGIEKPMTHEGLLRLQQVRQSYLARGKQVLILSVADMVTDERTFVGMLVFHDGSDPLVREHLSSLRRSGLRPILFVPKSKDGTVPDFPESLQNVPHVSATWLKENKLPITYEFGKYLRYDDVEEQDVLALLRALHRHRKRVAVLAFSDYASSVIEEADTVLACSDVQANFAGYLDEEIHTMENDGSGSSASCMQTLKAKADVLLARPHEGRGGLGALLTARQAIRSAYQNFGRFLDYMMAAQLLRLLVVALPMLFGSASLDARHVLFAGFGLDLVAMFFFVSDHGIVRKSQKNPMDFVSYIKDRRWLWFSILAGGLAVSVLPRWMDWLGWFGPYLYKLEFSFVSLIALEMVLFLFLRYEHPQQLLRDKRWMIYVAAVILLLLLCFLFPSFGLLLGIESHPLAYFLASLLPSVVFTAVYLLLQRYVTIKEHGA